MSSDANERCSLPSKSAARSAARSLSSYCSPLFWTDGHDDRGSKVQELQPKCSHSNIRNYEQISESCTCCTYFQTLYERTRIEKILCVESFAPKSAASASLPISPLMRGSRTHERWGPNGGRKHQVPEHGHSRQAERSHRGSEPTSSVQLPWAPVCPLGKLAPLSTSNPLPSSRNAARAQQ